MSIVEALKTEDERKVLLATAQKLGDMLDALPAHRTRDAAPLALQIRGITERLAVLEPPAIDEEAEEAKATVTSLTEKRRRKRTA